MDDSSATVQLELFRRRCEELEAELEEYRERDRQSRKTRLDVSSLYQTCFDLTKTESLVLTCLLQHELVTRDYLFNFIYGGRPDGGPDVGILNVFVFKLRQKLQWLDIDVQKVWGVGYKLSPEAKATIHELVAKFNEASNKDQVLAE